MAGNPEPQWVMPFLAGLEASGNVTWSAAQAGVDVTTIYRRRNRRPDFAKGWAKALANRNASPGPDLEPPLMPGRRGRSVPKEELVERICSRNGPQLVRVGAGRWSRRAEDSFLAELAACANVKRAAAAAGFSPTVLYRRRLKDRHFADSWDAALSVGRTRIEAYLVEAADRTFDPDCAPVDADLPKMTVAEAIKVLQLANRSTAIGAPGRGPGRGWTGPGDWDDPDDEEAVAQARENIFNRLERLRENEDEEKLASGWTRDGDDWVPPGYARVGVAALPGSAVVDAEAREVVDDAGAEQHAGPRIRGL